MGVGVLVGVVLGAGVDVGVGVGPGTQGYIVVHAEHVKYDVVFALIKLNSVVPLL